MGKTRPSIIALDVAPAAALEAHKNRLIRAPSCGAYLQEVKGMLSIIAQRTGGLWMSDVLTEEQMRDALFSGLPPSSFKPRQNPAAPKASEQPRPSKLRVTLHVTKVFEGHMDVFVYESNTLSRLVAELEAKNAARKKKYKYIDVVSVQQI